MNQQDSDFISNLMATLLQGIEDGFAREDKRDTIDSHYLSWYDSCHTTGTRLREYLHGSQSDSLARHVHDHHSR
jgi:hypothetical protein